MGMMLVGIIFFLLFTTYGKLILAYSGNLVCQGILSLLSSGWFILLIAIFIRFLE